MSLKLQLRHAFRAAATRSPRPDRQRAAQPPFGVPCARCGQLTSRSNPCTSLEGEPLCTPCYLATRGGDLSATPSGDSNPRTFRTRTCLRCGAIKPLDSAHFYRKVRGAGYMNICRPCRDLQLRQNNRRICWGCWRIYAADQFSAEQWLGREQEPAYCLRCEKRRAKGKAIPAPRPGEKVCPRCLRPLPAREFYSLSGRPSAYCRPCTREYNRLQYRRRKRGGGGPEGSAATHAPRTLRILYNLQKKSEQDLVDAWARGESPLPAGDVPPETVDHGDGRRVRAFVRQVDHLIGLRAPAEARSRTEHETASPSPPPPPAAAAGKGKTEEAPSPARGGTPPSIRLRSGRKPLLSTISRRT